jgi:transcriptional regulator with XRE-family HTH domain
LWQYANLEMRRNGYLQAVAGKDVPQNRIRELREEIGMSQAELARRANTHPSALNKVESGARGLDQDWMRRLAPLLGCAPADLLPDLDNPDRLGDEERALVMLFRSANAVQRKQIFALIQTLLSPEQIELLRQVA